ncbi:hypothetical protein G7059_04335 [Erysipelothrix sp. HDW6A]|uniref:DUF6054 family protein n=1 Tax=Erysipelothrix sp. HDW6A TaxID=2714928 RepID=UPI00140A50C6|nr:DUF6054 family protein [Erysipelothrix sp. HDW6A]QIK57129.1 hypothetical protein G7059_04335 [Erysipelothrix sp. HDW6A]
MAKYIYKTTGDYQSFLNVLDNSIRSMSISMSFEDSYNYHDGTVNVSTRVYERYSYFGKNRLSLTVTIVGNGEDIEVAAITAGGSEAVFFKINTVGENNLLYKFKSTLESLTKTW